MRVDFTPNNVIPLYCIKEDLSNRKGALNMDIDEMTCDELKEEIIRMIKEIHDVEILKKIYYFLKELIELE